MKKFIRTCIRTIKEKIKYMSIGKKLIFSGYMVMTPIFLAISIILAINNYRVLEEKNRNQVLQSTRTINEGISLLRSEMEDICTYISINTDINQLLTLPSIYCRGMDSQVWVNQAPIKMVEDMVSLKSYVKTIAIYPENGLRPYLRCMDSTSHISDLKQIKKSDIYASAIKKKGKTGWISVGKDDNNLYQQNRKEKIVLYRAIYNLSKTESLALLVIGADKEYFEDLCEKTIDSEKEGIIILSVDSGILVQTGQVVEEVADYLMTEEYLTGGKEISNYKDYTIYRVEDEQDGVIVCQVEPKYTLHSSMKTVFAEPVAFLLGFLIGLFPILFLISRVVTKPLSYLRGGMERFKKGDFNQKLEVLTYDEVGQVTECFNDMVDEIRELVNKNYIMALKEKESELIALQAQINPHFLYNTLDALYWQAQNADNEEIAEDILSLSNLFRMVLGQGKGIVTVREEVQLITEYLHVQKMRFAQKLIYEINVAEDIKDYIIPKLVLQPFVENAIVHGFEKQQENCRITVSGHREGEYIKFVVADTGAGMNEEQIAAIFEEDTKKRYSGQRVGRYAVKNVKERLTLKFQDNFVLDIASEIGKGTKVIIKIPYETD